jgi:TRAP-type uncharacterized transport system fused permease subunit
MGRHGSRQRRARYLERYRNAARQCAQEPDEVDRAFAREQPLACCGVDQCVAVGIPLDKMGVPLLTAHLFVFYFGVVSDLTPPTAVSCYVAGGIAGESGMRVAFSATRVALPALIVPFMFVYSPALILNGSVLQILVASVPALLGLLALSIALIGYWMGPLRLWERGASLLAGVLMVVPGLVNAALGVAVMAVVAFAHWRRRTA